MADPTYRVITGFANPVPETDVFRIALNRSRASLFEKMKAGTGMIQLDNKDGTYSPNNTASPYYGSLTVNQSIHVEAETDAGSTYKLFTGFIDSYVVDPAIGKKTMVMKLTDRTKQLFLEKTTTELNKDTTVTSAVTDILDGFLSAPDYSVDVVSDKLPYTAFADEMSAKAMDKIIQYGNHTFYMAADGTFRFRGRHTGLDGSVVNSYDEFFSFNYTLNDNDVRNSIRVSGEISKEATSVATVAWIETPMTINSGSSKSFWLSFVDPANKSHNVTPVNNVTEPQSGTDYTTNTLSGGSGTDLASATSIVSSIYGASVYVTVTNSAGREMILNKLQYRGNPIQQSAKIEYQQDASSSQAVYGKHSFTLTNELIDNLSYARGYAEHLDIEKRDPQNKIAFSLKNVFPDQVQHEIGQVLHLVEPNTAVNSKMTITHITHDIALVRGLEHKTSYKVEDWIDKKYLILDHATNGKLDLDRVLAF